MKNPNIERVLVIGGGGNIGSRLTVALHRVGYVVRVLQHRTAISAPPGVDVVRGDLSEASRLRSAMDGVGAVCHFVRAHHEATAEEWVNCCLIGTKHLLEAARFSSVRRMIIGCGDNIFGVPKVPHPSPIRETTERLFNWSEYSLWKILEEELIRQYRVNFGLPVTLTIFPLVWREELLADGIRNVDHGERFVRQVVDCEGKDFTRQDIHMDDAIQAILRVLACENAVGETFLFSAARPYASSEIAHVLHRAFGYPIRLSHLAWYSWSIDHSKAVQMLGYQPQVDLLKWLEEAYASRKGSAS